MRALWGLWRSLKAWIALRRLARETPWRDWFGGDGA